MAKVCEATTKNVFVYQCCKENKITVELENMKMAQPPEENLQPLPRGDNTESSNTKVKRGNDLVDQALYGYFGFLSFRPLQKDIVIILPILDGDSILTIVGTGGGKTLMYMLPAVLSAKPMLRQT